MSMTDIDVKAARAPSPLPPGGLEPREVPQFVAFGFDDNGIAGRRRDGEAEAAAWVVEAFGSRRNPAGSGNALTFDGAPCRATFFQTSGYLDGSLDCPDPEDLAVLLGEAASAGFELANHTRSHPHGRTLSIDAWIEEMDSCERVVSSLRKPAKGSGVSGFRTPYLEYNDATFEAALRLGFAYDASVEEGWNDDQDGGDYLWPYTLRLGLWELPLHAAVVPPDDTCERCGVEPGLRSRIAARKPGFDARGGKISGLDWNLLVDYGMDKAEYLATLKHSFDLRIAGNRCPLLFGGHSDIYAALYPGLPLIAPEERRGVVEEFLDYALSYPATRIVAYADVLAWLQGPEGLGSPVSPAKKIGTRQTRKEAS
jgi:hypothetical protein